MYLVVEKYLVYGVHNDYVHIWSFEIFISIKDDALFLIINYECLGYH